MIQVKLKFNDCFAKKSGHTVLFILSVWFDLCTYLIKIVIIVKKKETLPTSVCHREPDVLVPTDNILGLLI